MRDFITDNVLKQGDKGAMNVAPLLYAMVDKMFSDPATGVSPVVVNIGDVGTVDGTKTTYEIITPHAMLSSYIEQLNESNTAARLFVYDGGTLIGFPYLEMSGNEITGVTTTNDGFYYLHLSNVEGQSYFYHDDEPIIISRVTQGEIEGYKELFGAEYSQDENVFKVIVGTTSIGLTPGEMMLVAEEYNKSSNDADYTAMWAYSKAKYICCPPWFEGFVAFKLHSAFFRSTNLIYVDMGTPELTVATLASTFSGCSRLEQITGILKIASNVPLTDAFKGCGVLHSVKIKGLSSNIDLSDCAQLSMETIEYMIENSTQPGATSIVITLHADVINNIHNNSGWADVRALLAEKTYITIQSANS